MKYRVTIVIFFISILIFGFKLKYQEDSDLKILNQDLKVESNPIQEDINLTKWLEENNNNDDILKLPKDKFLSYIKKYGLIDQSFLKLKYFNQNSSVSKEHVKEALSYIEFNSSLRKRVGKYHPLTPYIIEELLNTNLLEESQSKYLLSQLQVTGSKSCPLKRAISEKYIKDYASSGDSYNLTALLKEISQFKSDKYKQSTIERIYKVLPKDNRSDFKLLLDSLSKEYSNIQYKKWFELEEEKENPEFIKEDVTEYQNEELLEEPLKSYYLSKLNANKRQCKLSKEYLIKALSIKKDNISFKDISDSLWLVDRCLKNTSQSRTPYWKELYDVLKQNGYSFEYEEYVKRKEAIIYWEVDRFEESKSIILGLISEIENKHKDYKYLIEDLLYLLAKIEANEGNIAKSTEYYRTLIKQYPKSESYYLSLKSLIHLSYKLNNNKEAIGYLHELLEKIEETKYDDMNISDYTYALYWLAKLEYKESHLDVARSIWKKLVLEYYSTFYGALAQYSLEKDAFISQTNTEDKNRKIVEYQMGPYSKVGFNVDTYMKEFSGIEKTIIKRGILLSKLGLKQDAECEFDEINYSLHDNNGKNKNKEKMIARFSLKILLDYISGDWLSLVKNYDKIPRTYRNKLAIGYEKLLFPVNYMDTILKYTTFLDLDPNLVLGIIRQESLFNNKARSNVGALGVMQLMPKTALNEYRRIKKTDSLYFNEIKPVKGKFNSNMINNVDLNIGLGVYHINKLLSLYDNAVFALSAYNANPAALNKWKSRYSTEDLLAFIEDIPYSETKSYIKLVMRNYFYYYKWYYNSKENKDILNKMKDNKNKIKEKDKNRNKNKDNNKDKENISNEKLYFKNNHMDVLVSDFLK